MIKGGYAGRLLRVDLSNQQVIYEDLPPVKILRQYVGGVGLAMKLLADEVPPDAKATDEANRVYLMTGPLSGSVAPNSSRHAIVSVSDIPQSCSVGFGGGQWAAKLKFAGFDGVIVQGKSEKPVYVYVHEGKAEIRDAASVWGQDTHDTEDLLKSELGDPEASVLTIGPAGENLIKNSVVANDKNHIAAKSNGGVAMGSKKLKAIVVGGPQTPVRLADPEKAIEAALRWRHVQLTSGPKRRKNGGNIRNLQRLAADGKTMVKNLSDPKFAPIFAKHVTDMLKQSKLQPRPCFNCPMGCAYDIVIGVGACAGRRVTLAGGLENIEGISGNVGVTDGGVAVYLTDVMDRLGLDSACTGETIGLAYECYERGILTRQHTDGLELRWGNWEAALVLLDKIVKREGFGAVLTDGPKKAAEAITKLTGQDAMPYSAHMKSTGSMAHDLRNSWEVMMGLAVSTGGSAIQGMGVDQWMPEPDLGYPEKPPQFDKKRAPWAVRETQLKKQWEDSLGVCWFATWGVPDITKILSEMMLHVVGWDIPYEEGRLVGERVTNLQRVFNQRRGYTVADDLDLGPRLLEAPDVDGYRDKSIGPHLEEMVKTYYEQMGWERETGIPTQETLTRLGLESLID